MAASKSAAGASTRGFGRFWRAVRQVFHELVGAVFAVLALGWVNAALRASQRDVARWLIATAVAVALMMAYFSWTSFRNARRLR
jgi:hypothetical protein